ncbi:chorismate synthase, partial [Gemmiger formicilis]|uniref:chorismate synthase n=1 Tax=Gemmiger formicilis TaxID=745368 RepID=UPI003C6CC916
LTACRVFAGAVCRQILERRGITITANAVRVGQATGKELNFDMKRAILDARSAGDSVGSELECVVTGVPARGGGGRLGGRGGRHARQLDSHTRGEG